MLGRHREPHRLYHGVRHLEFVVGDLVEVLSDEAAPTRPPDHGVVIAAAFFHDVVYDPRSSTNEIDSAAFARRLLTDVPEWGHARLDELERLVLLTRSHLATDDDPAGALLCDADLAILGADPGVYEAYRRGVRAEYAHVPDDAWRTGRARVLESFLEREIIFRTQWFRSREFRARSNLTAELASLAN